MSLRDIYGTNEDRPIILNTDPVGNTGGLGGFHTINPEDREPNNMPKILGGLAVALMLGAAGAYVYSVSGHQPKQIVAANSLPAPSAPVAAAAPAPLPASDNTPAATAPAPTPAADVTKPESKPVSVHQASVSKSTRTASSSRSDMGAANARMQADSAPAVQPQQQAVVTPVEPVSPQAPASAQANVAQPSNPEVAPQADSAAPAQDQQTGATPAPVAPAAPAPAQ
jgi:hypothetical protein